MDSLDHRLFNAGIAVVVVGMGVWLVVWLVRKLSAQEETKGERLIQKALSKGDRVGAAKIAFDHGHFERSGRLYIDADRIADAARAYKRGKVWAKAAAAYERVQDWDGAAFSYKKMGDQRNHLRMLKEAGNWADAARIAVDEGKHSEAAAMLLKIGRKKDAIELYRKAGDNARLHHIAAELAEETGEYGQAARHWANLQQHDRAIANFKKANELQLAAQHLARIGRVGEAAEMLASNKLHPQAAVLYEQLQMFRKAAAQHSQAGDPERAIQCLTLEGDRIAVVKLRIARGETDIALRLAESVVSTETYFAEAMQIAADLRQQMDDGDGALKDLYRAMQAGLDNASRLEVGRRAAELCVDLGRPTTGRKLLSRIEDLITAQGADREWFDDLMQQFNELRDESEPAYVPSSVGMAESIWSVEDVTDDETTQNYHEGTVAYVDGYAQPTDESDFGIEVSPDGWPQGVPVSLAKRYSELERLGQGGNGVVFRGIDTLLDRVVVLKFMLDGSMPTEVARRYFQREIKMAASLSHPNIVHIYDMGNIDNVLYYSMEFVDGRPLTAHLPPNQPVQDKVFICSVVEQLCAALDHAHGKDMVHRDIKPDNVLISHDGETKLLDFGLARILDEGFGDQSVLAGTPFYMAPEQIDGSVVDHRADIYALGVILFRMFTGRLPFTEGNIFVAHALEPVPDPLQFDPTMPQGVVDVINRCMEKKPDQRYDNCGLINLAIRQALLDDLSSEPPADQTPS